MYPPRTIAELKSNIEIIEQLIKDVHIEQEQFEFKEGENNGVIRSTIAMLNTFGGLIIVGVKEKKGDATNPFEVVGIIDESRLHDVVNNVMPDADDLVKSEVVDYKGKKLLAIEIRKDPWRIFIKRGTGACFVRVGSSSVPATPEVIERLYTNRVQLRKMLPVLIKELEEIQLDLRNIQGVQSGGSTFPSRVDVTGIKQAYYELYHFLLAQDLVRDFNMLFRNLRMVNDKLETIMQSAKPFELYKDQFGNWQIGESANSAIERIRDAILPKLQQTSKLL